MAEPIDRRDAILLLGMLLVGACGGAKSKASGAGSTTSGSTPVASTTTSTTAVAGTTTAPTYVRGHNQYLTRSVLQSDAQSYDGTWAADWQVPATGENGTIEGSVKVDPDARSFTVTMTVRGPLLGGSQAPPPIAVTVAADSFVYDDASGTFSIGYPTAIGDLHLHDDGGFGRFVLDITAVRGVAGVRSFSARGVANRPNEIPVSFVAVANNGVKRAGTIAFRPAR